MGTDAAHQHVEHQRHNERPHLRRDSGELEFASVGTDRLTAVFLEEAVCPALVLGEVRLVGQDVVTAGVVAGERVSAFTT